MNYKTFGRFFLGGLVLVLLAGNAAGSSGQSAPSGSTSGGFSSVVTQSIYFHRQASDSAVTVSGKYLGNLFLFPVLFVGNTFSWLFLG